MPPQYGAVGQDITGDWQGTVEDGPDSFRYVFRIRRDDRGELSALVDNLDEGDVQMPLEGLSFEDGRLSGHLRVARADLDAQIDAGGSVLRGHLRVMGKMQTLVLRRDRPEWRPYLFPRLDASGEPLLSYTYRVPEEVDDGWETAPLGAVGLDEEAVSGLGQAILEGVYPQAHSVLVVRDGKLVFEEYFHGYRRDLRHGIQSATKSVTSIVVGLAIDRGAIQGVSQPIYTFFPERRGRRWIDERHSVTLHHLLTMTAALDWQELLPYTDPRNDNTAMNMSDDWVGYVLDRGLAGTPGERYEYCSGLSILLGAVVKNATGRYVDEYAEEHLFGPLGITDYRWSAAPDGTRHTGGGLSLRPRDAAKIGAMILHRGVWGGRRILSEAWARESTRQHTAPGDYPYGYQWHMHAFGAGETAVDSICAAGYGGQWLFLFPTLDLEVVLTAGAYGADSKPYDKVERHILPALGR